MICVSLWNLCVCVCVSVLQKDVWILAASLPKWDTQNRSSGLASRTQSTVNYHALCSYMLDCVLAPLQCISMAGHGSICVLMLVHLILFCVRCSSLSHSTPVLHRVEHKAATALQQPWEKREMRTIFIIYSCGRRCTRSEGYIVDTWERPWLVTVLSCR